MNHEPSAPTIADRLAAWTAEISQKSMDGGAARS
jgi:hypothetical protein